MKISHLFGLGAVAVTSMAFASASHAAVTFTEITPYDATTYWSTPPTAGLDFDDGTSGNYADPTQSGFLSVPASNSKTYDLVHNGITFDIDVTNANQGNQNRNRNNTNAGALMTDFEQWYRITTTPGDAVEASVTLTGLVANTDYEISFFTANVGAGQTTHSFYEGTSSSDPLITTFSTSGSQNDYPNWKPGIMFTVNSGVSGEVSLTIQATEDEDQVEGVGTGTYRSRLTLDGIAVNVVPEPSSLALLGLGGLLIARRRRG